MNDVFFWEINFSLILDKKKKPAILSNVFQIKYKSRRRVIMLYFILAHIWVFLYIK